MTKARRARRGFLRVLGLAGLAPLALAAPARALAAPGPTAKEQLQRFITEVNTAQGQFTQSGSAGAAPIRGRFVFERPGKFRWEIISPYPQLVLSDGATVYQYDPDLEQVTQRDADQALGATPAALLFGSGGFEELFSLQSRPDAHGLQWLRAIPRGTEAGFVHLDIGFAAGLPRELELQDAFGQSSRIEFAALETNIKPAAGEFQLDLPPDVAVIRMN